MPYPTPSEFTGLLQSEPLQRLVREYLFEGEPYIFGRAPGDYASLRAHLTAELNVPSDRITIVGSARLGFSLNPDRFGQPFSNTSDVDVIVVDEALFDEIWHVILRWHYPRRTRGLVEAEQPWTVERRRDVYWGHFTPSTIRFDGLTFPSALRRLRDIAAQWFNAFQSVGLNPRLAGHAYASRLYRTWEHATLYHESGLQVIRERLSSEAGTL